MELIYIFHKSVGIGKSGENQKILKLGTKIEITRYICIIKKVFRLRKSQNNFF